MKKKAVFFDIDGTLWGSDNIVPQSAVDAIHGLQKNGHLAFICSGRTRGFIQNEKLLGIGFDGIVSGCGTMVEYGGKTVFCKEIEKEQATDTVKLLYEYGFLPILEGKEYLYLEESDFAGDAYGRKLMTDLGERRKSIREYWGKWEISKFSCGTPGDKRDECFEKLAPLYDFMIHNSVVAELVPKGFHKGTGIQKVCELLDLDIEDTIAFGDGANDIGMFQTAGTAVAMGNGSDAAKASADLVTAPLTEDGIRKACKKLELI